MISRKEGIPGERTVVLPPVLVEMEEKDELCESLFITDIGHYPRAEHRQHSGGLYSFSLSQDIVAIWQQGGSQEAQTIF